MNIKNQLKTMIAVSGIIFGIAGSGQLLARTNLVGYYATEIISIQKTGVVLDHKNEVEVKFNLPCDKDYVGLASDVYIHGSPLNPASDFSILIGVVLKENGNTCDINTEPSNEVSVKQYFNTMAVEGSFLGFEAIQDPKHLNVNSSTYIAFASHITKVESLGNGYDKITMEVDVPCWADMIGVTETMEIFGSPADFGADTGKILTVYGAADPSLSCAGVMKHTTTHTSYSFMAEGTFLGYTTLNLL